MEKGIANRYLQLSKFNEISKMPFSYAVTGNPRMLQIMKSFGYQNYIKFFHSMNFDRIMKRRDELNKLTKKYGLSPKDNRKTLENKIRIARSLTPYEKKALSRVNIGNALSKKYSIPANFFSKLPLKHNLTKQEAATRILRRFRNVQTKRYSATKNALSPLNRNTERIILSKAFPYTQNKYRGPFHN